MEKPEDEDDTNEYRSCTNECASGFWFGGLVAIRLQGGQPIP